MVFIGMDHGTTGISFCLMDDDEEILDIFKIDREDSKNGKVSAIEELSKRCDLNSVKLMAITYAMGDGINDILPIDKVEDRGILSINGAGKVTGGGTSVFSELANSNIPSIMIPGLHKNSTSLNDLFNAAYSHQASPEKVSISYNAIKETNWQNFIVADISSNSVNILLENSKIKGAIDACIENYKNGDEKAKLSIDTLIMTVAMEIAGLAIVCENEIEGIVLTGSIGSTTQPFNFKNELNKYFKNKYELKVISKESGAIGAAQIAHDVYNGVDNILGIAVDLS